MAFTRYASLEQTEVLDIKGSENQIRTASLDKVSDYNDFRTSDGYLYARIRAISSRVNRNNDGWPSVELAGSPEIFNLHHAAEGRGFTVEANKDAEYGFSTFLGKPIFVDHNNSDPKKARGVIVDAKFHVEDAKTAALDPYYSSKTVDASHKPAAWVELLLEVDAKEYPKLAKAIIDGSKDSSRGIDGFSMGANVESTTCSICDNKAHTSEDFCKHVRQKGAHFDFKDSSTGEKTSKKAYENCHGVQFFEISAVFEPADETALIREVKHAKTAAETCPMCHGDGVVYDKNNKSKECPRCYGDGELVKTASEPDSPQSELTKAPHEVNTLRDEQICPICGSHMGEETCDICGYVAAPDGFDNPDLSKAKEEGQNETNVSDYVPDTKTSLPVNDSVTSHITSDMKWILELHPKVAKINKVEKPILLTNEKATNEPNEKIIRDQSKPVTSALRTAQDMIAAAKNKEKAMANRTSADAPAGTAADKRIDVDGVGGFSDASNEAASQADAQVDVLGKGGVGVSDVSADKTISIEETSDNAGFDGGKNVESIPTKTWSGQKGQTSPITNTAFPSDGGVHSSWKISYDDGVFPKEDGGLSGGGAVKGVQPVAETFGERVDVLDHVTSPANNSGKTKTWSGTDGNGVTKQVDPVTRETLEGSDAPKLHTTSALIFSAFKLADLEIELGLLDEAKKYERVAELEAQGPEAVTSSLQYAQRVKKAGVTNRVAKTATRVPSLSQAPQAKTAAVSQTSPYDSDDSSLFI